MVFAASPFTTVPLPSEEVALKSTSDPSGGLRMVGSATAFGTLILTFY